MHLLGNLSKKQALVFGFLIILALAIPITLYVIQHQQNQKSGATRSTALSFNPDPNSDLTINKSANIGDTVDLPIYVNPGSANAVSVVTIEITYDPNVLQIADSAKCISSTGVLSAITTQPQCTSGKALIRLAAQNVNEFISQEGDPSTNHKGKTQVADIKFIVKQTAQTSTEVDFTPYNNLSGSNAGSSLTQDLESNVIASYGNAIITIGSVVPTDTPAVNTETPVPTDTPPAGNGPTPTGTSSSTNTAPVCSSLSTDVATSGSAPYAITFSANGQAAGSASLVKATFNFGDGSVQDVAINSGPTVVPTDTPAPTDTPFPTDTPDPNGAPTDTPIPTDTPNPTDTPTVAQSGTPQLAHTYTSSGTYTASVTFTDTNGLVSVPGSCTKVVTISGAQSNNTSAPQATDTPATAVIPSATPTIAPTGPGETFLGIGAAGFVLTIIGGLLFFIL